MDEIACWQTLSERKQRIYTLLLKEKKEFQGFLDLVDANADDKALSALIRDEYRGRICQHADIAALAEQKPCELAYALSLINTTDYRSVTPGWVLHNYPGVEYVMEMLRQRKCTEADCDYCRRQLDIHQNLKLFFSFLI